MHKNKDSETVQEPISTIRFLGVMYVVSFALFEIIDGMGFDTQAKKCPSFLINSNILVL